MVHSQDRTLSHTNIPTYIGKGTSTLFKWGTLSSCPAVHLNCIRDPLYLDACISISDRVLIQVCMWVVFGESPSGAGSLLAHSSRLLFIFIVHTSKNLFVIFC